jgi:hypothetical protein
MIQINGISSYPSQQFTVVGAQGENISFNLYYLPGQQGWFYDVSYGSFTVTGQRLVVSLNTLNQWVNIIEFGLMCMSTDGYDPLYIDDFTTGRIALYLLTQADIAGITALAIDLNQ